jgi:hypothetical protein
MERTRSTYNMNTYRIQNFDSETFKLETALGGFGASKERGNRHINIYLIKIYCEEVKCIT